jgi:hypothetical protein
VGIKQHQRAGAETFEPTDIVFAKPAALVQSARVSEGMSPACSIDVEVNSLLADGTLCEKRVKSDPGLFLDFRRRGDHHFDQKN